MAFRIDFAPEARDDLRSLYLFIAERAGDDRALAYVERIEAFCRGFADFPVRGTARDDLLPGLRIIGFERRFTIAFHLGSNSATFDRILYAGRQFEPSPT